MATSGREMQSRPPTSVPVIMATAPEEGGGNCEKNCPARSCCPDFLALEWGSLWHLSTTGRTTNLKQLPLQAVGVGATITSCLHFSLPSSLAIFSFNSPPRDQHLPEAVCLATSHPSSTALSWQGDLPEEEDDFPQRARRGGLPVPMGYHWPFQLPFGCTLHGTAAP